MVEVERRRDDLVPDRQYGENRFDRARRPEKMTDRRFGRRHRDGSRRVAKNFLDGPYLDFIAERSRGSVCIDVIDIAWRYSGSLDCRGHGAERSVAALVGRSDVKGVARHAVTR